MAFPYFRVMPSDGPNSGDSPFTPRLSVTPHVSVGIALPLHRPSVLSPMLSMGKSNGFVHTQHWCCMTPKMLGNIAISWCWGLVWRGLKTRTVAQLARPPSKAVTPLLAFITRVRGVSVSGLTPCLNAPWCGDDSSYKKQRTSLYSSFHQETSPKNLVKKGKLIWMPVRIRTLLPGFEIKPDAYM